MQYLMLSYGKGMPAREPNYYCLEWTRLSIKMLKMLTFQLSDENINIILTFVMLFSPDFCVLQEYAKVLQIQVNSNVVNPQIYMFQIRLFRQIRFRIQSSTQGFVWKPFAPSLPREKDVLSRLLPYRPIFTPHAPGFLYFGPFCTNFSRKFNFTFIFLLT